MTAFDRVIAHRDLGGGRYAIEVHDGWGAPVGPNGGYVAALVLNAMMASPGAAGRPPRSLTLHYLRSPQPGEAVVEVTEERVGGTLTTLSARLVQDGRPCVAALGAFAGSYETAAEFAEPMPAVAGLDDVARVSTGASPYTLLERLDLRQTFGPPPFSGDKPVSGGWTALAERQPLEPCVLALYADAWWPSVWGRLERLAAAPTIDLTIHFRSTPAPDDDGHVLAHFESRTATEGYFEEDGRLWARDGRLLVHSRQIALLRQARGATA